MVINVQPITKSEYIDYCIPNNLDPVMFQIRVEKLGWSRDKSSTEPLVNFNSDRIFSCAEMEILIDNAPDMKPSELMKLLPGRGSSEISRRKTMLGLGLSDAKRREILVKNVKDISKLDYSITLSDLSDIEKSVLFGCLFGDGCVCFNNRTENTEAIFTSTHCTKQIDYNIWKSTILSRFGPRLYEEKTSGHGVYSRFCTCCHPIFTQLRAGLYGDTGKERLPLMFVRELGYLGLLIWYLDDGSLNSRDYSNTIGIRRGYMTIAIEKILYSEVAGAVDCINEELGLSLLFRSSVIYFETESMVKLIPIFEELFLRYDIPDCMLYKLGLENRDQLVGLKYFGIDKF